MEVPNDYKNIEEVLRSLDRLITTYDKQKEKTDDPKRKQWFAGIATGISIALSYMGHYDKKAKALT